jgi:8-oxo-dGTP pyrophosphatase MutT (NUDIX family)
MMIKQLPITIRAAHKSDVRTQFSALCYRINRGKPEFLLVTTRRSGRWIAPKGWPMDGMTPAASAAHEAWEEAGVVGKAHDLCLGIYSYNKELEPGDSLPCLVMVYPVKVKSLDAEFPEKNERRSKWFSAKKAAARVAEPELSRIIRDFDPKALD